jgi:hypothetical protein
MKTPHRSPAEGALNVAITEVEKVDSDDPRIRHAIDLLYEARARVEDYMAGRIRMKQGNTPIAVKFTDANHLTVSISATESEMCMYQRQIAKQMAAVDRHLGVGDEYKFDATLTMNLHGTWVQNMNFNMGERLDIGFVYDYSSYALKVPLK